MFDANFLPLSQPLEKDRFVINKSRYDSIDSYLSCDVYSDIDLVYDKDLYRQLIDGGNLHMRHVKRFSALRSFFYIFTFLRIKKAQSFLF